MKIALVAAARTGRGCQQVGLVEHARREIGEGPRVVRLATQHGRAAVDIFLRRMCPGGGQRQAEQLCADQRDVSAASFLVAQG